MIAAGTTQTGRRLKVLTCLSAAAVIFAPALVFVTHGSGHNTENRTQASYRGLDGGWDYFGNLGNYIADRLPLKTSAVRADAWIDEHVYREDAAFGGSATPRVLRGLDGFLFIKDAIDVACTPNAPAEATAAHFKELAEVIADSGRDVLSMVAPDKSSVHAELLPPDLAQRDCFDAYTEQLWSDLNSAEIEGFVDLRQLLIDESNASREALYLRKDTHWDSAGSLVAVHAMVDHYAPGLWSDDEVQYQGLGTYVGDLTNMQGKPEQDDAPLYAVVRPDITVVSVEQLDDLEGGLNRRFISEGPPGRLIEGRTVMFYDSFGIAALAQIVPFFADLTVIALVDYDPQRYLNEIQNADNVWIMSVERSASYRFEFEIGSRELLDLLHAQLVQRS